MIVPTAFAGKTVGVFGLARTGLSSVRALNAGRAKVFGWDDDVARRASAVEAGATECPWHDWPWDQMAALVLSPGVPLTHPSPHPVVERARAARVPVIGDFELFAREIRPDRNSAGRAPVVAVTGTNGKSTTTALIGHVLAASGFDAQIGGNIGKPVLDLAPPGPRTVYVLEISTYQIDLAPAFTPDIAALLNLSSDHLDRHGTMQNYAAVKERLLTQTSSAGRVLVSVDDPYSAAIFTRASAKGRPKAVPVSVGKVLGRGVFVLDGILYDAQTSRASKIMELIRAERLVGVHNWQNAAFAYAACEGMVSDPRALGAAIASFPGLPHRMEEVGRAGNVRFINDSKATNADATERALVCFDDIYWIVGGRAKDGGIDSLRRHFGRIRRAYLIGEAANSFATTLQGSVPVELSGTLAAATAQAAADAAKSGERAPVVLLSPACASFDQFKDFEARGDAFRALVSDLQKQQPVLRAS